MNRNSAGIATVFVIFLVPIILMSLTNSGGKGWGGNAQKANLNVAGAIQAHIFSGNSYVLKKGGELYRNNKLFKRLPSDTLDFSIDDNDLYVLRQDGVYCNDEIVWRLEQKNNAMPHSLVMLHKEEPKAYIIFSDGSYIVRTNNADELSLKQTSKE